MKSRIMCTSQDVDDAPDLVEEEAVVGIEDVGEMEIGDDAVEFEEALC